MTRDLTPSEIDKILSIVTIDSRAIPARTNQSIIGMIQAKLLKQLQRVQVVDAIVPTLIAEIETQYHKSQCQYGEAIGILLGQSIGENTTQSTLNSFHASGITVNLVSTGIPRFNELISATACPKYNSIGITLDQPSLVTPRDVRDYIGSSLKEIYFDDMIHGVPEIITCLPKWWQFRHSNRCIAESAECAVSFKINKDLVYKYRLDLETVKNSIEDIYDDFEVVYSPLCLLEIVIICKLPKNVFEPPAINDYIYDCVVPNLKKCLVFGIAGIKDYIFTKHPTLVRGWLLQTDGTNLKGFMGLPKFDYSTALSNNLLENYTILGIEAAREFLFTELKKTLNDGNYINDRHIDLLVDIMTHRGVLTSVSRYGSRGCNSSPLSRVSFEETLDNFLRASYMTEKEDLKSVSASVMVGKIPKIGTGFCDLVQKFDF